MSPEEQQRWKDGVLAAIEGAPSGVRKQYSTEVKGFFEPSWPAAEYVQRLE